MSDTVTAFAPASIGNVGVGFDMLGLAIEGIAATSSNAVVDHIPVDMLINFLD